MLINQTKKNEIIKNNTNSKLNKDVEKLEKESFKIVRELLLDLLNGKVPSVASKAQLQKAEDEIVTLREQRK